jgi:alkylated DNA repair dioxygenase AlkB
MFTQLKDLVNPIPHRILVYGEHDEPRLTGMYSKTGGTFTYSGVARPAKAEWPEVIQRLVAIATAAYPKLHCAACVRLADAVCDCPAIEYDSALINLYRNGKDNVSWHRDKDAIDQPIASFTFYATDIEHPRPFYVRQYGRPGADRMVWNIPNRSFLLMLPGMNVTHEHSVPSRANFDTPRINVTLRAHKRGTAEEVE